MHWSDKTCAEVARLISFHRKSVRNCCTYPPPSYSNLGSCTSCAALAVRKQQLLPVSNATATKIYRDFKRLDFAFQEGMLL